MVFQKKELAPSLFAMLELENIEVPLKNEEFIFKNGFNVSIPFAVSPCKEVQCSTAP
jgi:hypothetical protein